MISPKYAKTHYFHPLKVLAQYNVLPHVVNLYLDYNCPFSAKMYAKLYQHVIPQLHTGHPGQFQFVFVNVIQPWHPNSVMQHEFALAYAQILAEKTPETSNVEFWEFSKNLFDNIELFYDTATVNLGRNEIYERIYACLTSSSKVNVLKDEILQKLSIVGRPAGAEQSNLGNEATNDVKYFTKYLRGVGAHVTPTISVDGVIDNGFSSGADVEDLVKQFEAYI